MNRILILLFLPIFLFSCGGEESKPEDVLKEFIIASNENKSLSKFHDKSSVTIKFGFKKSRKYAEKLNPDKINCEVSENIAECTCETNSGKIRKFKLIKEESEWQISLNEPEIILDIFHIMYTQGMLSEIKPFATKTELDRLQVFESMTAGMEIPETEKKVVPFDIQCKEYKKKFECTCTSSEGVSSYVLYKSSEGWKAELGEGSIVEDTLIDYNSSENFNLNQHDLDSLTDFSQKMLDSMLNL
jgi:hypothetical protein